ncbi:type IV secretion system protein VirB10 (plasmid) [Guyparkeria sp. 1SP6A2]|nr:type IV secretion system protein VirB10 [Guyparkeria sp. 1SP6A2]
MSEEAKENTRNDQAESADRGMPSINRGKAGGGTGQKIVMVVGMMVLLLALGAVNGLFSSDDEPVNTSKGDGGSDGIGSVLGPAPELPDPPEPKAEPEPEPEPEPEGILNTGQIAPPPPEPAAPSVSRDKEKEGPTPQERKMQSALLAVGGSSGRANNETSAEARAQAQARRASASSGGGMGMMGGESEADRADGLEAALEPTKVKGMRAGLIENRDMFITKGTFLDCALETALSSDVPGMTSCRLTQDVYSTSGRVLLLERGSKIVGEYESGMRRGQARLFVLWTRIETPAGVIVNLDSPGSDPLGRMGHSGYVDKHFWERFGSAMMLSFVDDFGKYAMGRISEGDNNQIQLDSTGETTEDMAAIALRDSINIPPTLLKHQGEHINIFVARDLDFRGVYELKAE